MLVLIALPLQVVLCAAFLYRLLGWRCVYHSFCEPICAYTNAVRLLDKPSWLLYFLFLQLSRSWWTRQAKRRWRELTFEFKRLQKVSLRLYRSLFRIKLTSSVAMNVVRMVKLFGWEGKMAKRIGEQREKELHWVKRTQWLTVSIHLTQNMISCSHQASVQLLNFHVKSVVLAPIQSPKIWPILCH